MSYDDVMKCVCEKYVQREKTDAEFSYPIAATHALMLEPKLTMIFEIWNREIWNDVLGIWKKECTLHRAYA